ncbi:MAG: hypothetical protein ACOYNS_07960 [Bacteroidota bacterium]
MSKLLSLIALLAMSLFGQTDDRTMFYGEIGFGLSSPVNTNASADYSARASLTFGKKLLCIRASEGSSGFMALGFPSTEFITKNLLLGHYLSVYHEYNDEGASVLEWNILIFAGYSAVKDILKTEREVNLQNILETKERTGFGIPVEIDIQYLIPRYRGATLKLFYNSNPLHRLYGASLSVVFGFV